MLNDLRFAVRALRQRPGYTAAAILTLALGVGANTSLFSVTEAILYHPLPLPRLDRLVTLEGGRVGRFDELDVSAADLMDLRERAKSFTAVSGSEWWTVNMTGQGFPERARGFRVAPDFFSILAVRPILGRDFTGQDHAAGANRVVILSETLWERKFARDPRVLGQVLRLDGEPYEIIGVEASTTRVPAEAELWAPLVTDERFRIDRVSRYQPLARLKDGVSLNQAAAEVKQISQRIAVERPDTNAGRDLRVMLLRERISGNLTAEYTQMAQLSALVLLLIAASNIANLLFAMVSSRSREIALRQALGSSRWRIVRQLLAESLVLGTASLPLAFILTLWGIDLNKRGMPPEVEIHLPGWSTIGLDLGAFAFGVTAALATAIVAGILPAWLASHADLNLQLREGGRALTSGSRGRLRAALVVIQVTLSMVLMAGAALMYRGANAMTQAAPARHPEQVLVSSVTLPAKKYPTAEKRSQFAQELLERARTMPGVTEAALILYVPYSGGWSTTHAETDQVRSGSTRQLPTVTYQIASPGYFNMLGIPVTSGRDLADSDGLKSEPVVVISELAAKQLFPKGDALGNRLKLDGDEWARVVGIVGDVMQEWVLRQPVPMVYRPYRQVGGGTISVLMRSATRTPNDVAPAWRTTVAQMDADLPVSMLWSQQRTIDLQMLGINYITSMLAVSGVMSMLLAAIGLYSLLSFLVAERTREMGIRMALGAQQRKVIGMVVGQGFRLAGLGLLIGLGGAMAVSQLFAGLLYGVTAFDPLSMGGGALALATGAALACYLPARRAAQVEPMVALRHD